MSENPTVQAKPAPRVCLFLAQPYGTLVGPKKPFGSLIDLLKWTRQECGFEGVSAPMCPPFVDPVKALESTAYINDTKEGYADLGVPLIRFENHVVGQQMLMHPANAAAYIKAFGPDLGPDATIRDYERAAQEATLMAVKVSAAFGFKHLPDFSGNRGWTAGLYPWAAYPQRWRLNILALLVAKHRKVIELCAELDVIRGFELHPQEDLHSPILLYLFRELVRAAVSDKAAKTVSALADASHFTLVGDNAAQKFAFLQQNGLLRMCHLKDGQQGHEFLDLGSPELEGGSKWGDFAPIWSKSMRRFCTFGTGSTDWDRIIPLLHHQHSIQPEPLDFVVEAECSRFPNMMQGIKIGAENARRARDKKPLLDVTVITPETTDGGNWEQFCVGPCTAAEMLYMNGQEQAAVREIIEKVPADLLERYF